MEPQLQQALTSLSWAVCVLCGATAVLVWLCLVHVVTSIRAKEAQLDADLARYDQATAKDRAFIQASQSLSEMPRDKRPATWG